MRSLLLAVSASLSAQDSLPLSPNECTFAEADRAWVERALAAWHFASHELAGIDAVPRFRALFFDADCVRTSDDALVRADAAASWSSAPHDGTIALPDGGEVSVGVTSFAKGADGLTYFVMSTPSVWSAAGVGRGADLERTMVGVMLHESSHVAQIGPYGKRLGALIERHALPDSFNDNAVQERFRANPEFAAAIANEIRLFAQAWAAEDEAEARYLASEARASMRARAARWFTGTDAYLLEAEDLWLTFEGSGQWLAYRWLIDTRGGGAKPADVLPRFTGDSQWSQAEGFALVLALDRFTASGWRKHAFGDGARTVLEMLDAALAE
ncbi:MAG: hypothetical protein ABL998_04085 [Planctomycetota bacterium]